MIIEMPDNNSIVKWKKNDNDEWKSSEISDLIKAYEERPQDDIFPMEIVAGKCPIEFGENCPLKPKGEWKFLDNKYYDDRSRLLWAKFKCACCGEIRSFYEIPETMGKFDTDNFCPNCGADMRGEKNDT